MAGSVPNGGNCRLAGTGSHPSSFLSEKEGWLESSKKGSFFRPGACLLPELEGIGAREKANELSRAGPLWLEMPEHLVEKLLGKPETVGQPVVTEATGDVTIQWSYPALGVTLEMLVPEKKGPKTLHSIWLKAPSTMQTTRGVRVGSPFSELEKVYANKKAPEGEGIDDGEHFVAGSVYGGMIFARGKDGTVASIFVGADAY